MLYKTFVEKSTLGIGRIQEAVGAFDKERYLYMLFEKRLNNKEVDQLLEDVKEAVMIVKKEYDSLENFAREYNESYATDHNGCYTLVQQEFRKMNRTIAKIKKVFRKSCPTMRNYRVGEMCSVFTSSPLVADNYMSDLFSLPSYGENVTKLYEAMVEFFAYVLKALKLCRDEIEEELRVENSPHEKMRIYRDSFAKYMVGVKPFLNSFELIEKEGAENHNLIHRKADCSLQDYVNGHFHKLDINDFKMHIALECKKKGDELGLTKDEILLWKENKEKVLMVRFVIKHFDELNPEGQRGKLSAKVIVAFMQWCQIKNRYNLFFKYFASLYHGQYQIPGYTAVNAANTRFTKDSSWIDTEEFNKQVIELMKNHSNDASESISKNEFTLAKTDGSQNKETNKVSLFIDFLSSSH